MKFDQLLEAARKHNASDMHLVVGLPPALRVSGEIIMARGHELTASNLRTLTDEILNDEQKRVLKTEMQLCFSMSHETLGRFRVSVYFRSGHPEMAIRVCNQVIKNKTELHLPKEIDVFLNKPSGLILITGPTGVGKTTTMTYMIDYINSRRRCKIVTIEDPVEFVHPHKNAIVIQQELFTDVKSFSSALIHVLRQDPDVIAIGEMRDYETISTALTAAETGHLVIATLHTPDVAQTMERIIGVYPPSQQSQVLIQLGSCLQGVISQQLVPTVDLKSRVLAYELLICNTAARNVIRQNECFKLLNIIETGSNQGMRTIDASLTELYEQGLISYDALLSRCSRPEEIKQKYNKKNI